MKRNILKAAAKNVTTPDRAADFYHCCMQEKMINSAFTCLLYTSDKFKVNILQYERDSISQLKDKDMLYIRLFVKKSFDVLKAFLDFLKINWKVSSTVRQFKHLYYSESDEKYLDLAEEYTDINYGIRTDKFDAKLSESIMKNHKDRVHSRTKFYINIVKTDILVKYSTVDDAKMYAAAVLPVTGYEFWSLNQYSIYKSIFDIIPEDKIYTFFKNYFAEHYPDTEFETHRNFYDHKYYKLLTDQEREDWALSHLKSKKQILGVGNDYRWYKFVKFELAFPEIKELISITKNADTRSDMIKILVKTAKSDRDLESLLIYYYKRHSKELRPYRDSFLEKVISRRNVFEFDEKCWASFYNVLLSMDLYNTADTKEKNINTEVNNGYKTIIVLYNVLYDEPFPAELMKYFLEDFDINYINDYLDDIDKEKYQKLHDFFFDTFMKNLVGFKHEPHSEAVNAAARRYFTNMKCSMATFHEEILADTHRPTENRKKTRYISDRLSDRKLLRDLKKDKQLVISQVSDVKAEYEESRFKLNNFLRKIKVYFPDDVSKVYLGMFEDLIQENKDLRPVKAGVYGIFDLGDENTKLALMNKYVPTSSKINPKAMDIGQLRVQKAICRYACISRPPLPLSCILNYMKGSYARYCLQVFNTYLAILPLSMCYEFVHLVIDTPISIQKHSIRLAFQCFSAENLINVITDLWGKTKNVSMRSVVYKALFNKVLETKQQMFVETLLKCTSSLHQNDEKELFGLVISNKLPEEFLGVYIESAWDAVGFFEDIEPNITFKEKVICCIQDKLHLVRKDFVLGIVQQHLDTMINEDGLAITYDNSEGLSVLCKYKWRLTAMYIMHYTRFGSSAEEYVRMSRHIVESSIDKWNDNVDDTFIYQKLLWDFFTYLKEASLEHNTKFFDDGLPIFENILSLVKPSLPYQDSYQLIWELELAVITRKTVKKNKKRFDDDDLCLYDVVIETMEDVSNELRKVVSVYAENKRFFMSYSLNINEIVKKNVRDVLHVMYCVDDGEDGRYAYELEYIEDVLITLASGLVEVDLPETYMLAVLLLPTNNTEKNFQIVFDKLHQYSDSEVQYSLYQKFRKLCKPVL